MGRDFWHGSVEITKPNNSRKQHFNKNEQLIQRMKQNENIFFADLLYQSLPIRHDILNCFRMSEDSVRNPVKAVLTTTQLCALVLFEKDSLHLKSNDECVLWKN